jgi:predicted phosphate transport protein (TIGR00153 family)
LATWSSPPLKFRLIPSTDEFFVLFSKAASNLAATAKAFQGVLNDFPNRESLHAAVRTHERTGDDLTQAILRELDTNFVTPFDREDIHALAEQIDDVVDDIYHLSEMLVILPFETLIPEFREQIDLLATMAERAVELVDRMSQMKGLRPLLEEIDNLESKGDAVYRRTLARLFSGEFTALDVIKWKDLIEAAEEAIDGIEDMGDIVATISFKHA